MFVLLVLLLCGRGRAQSQSGFNLPTAVCYTDINCTGSIIPLQPTVTAKDCCVGANDGRSYSHDGNCIVKVCIVHGFVNATYNVTEGGRLNTLFQLNVVEDTSSPALTISGTITAVAGGTANNTDFVAMDPIRVINTTEVSLLTFDDDITLEYDDTVILTFTPDDPGLISSLETAGEYIRDTATVNIIDNDFLQVYFEESNYSITEGSDLSKPISLMITNNQNPFNLILSAVTIDNVEDVGLGTFIDSSTIDRESRAGTLYNSTPTTSSDVVCDDGDVRLVDGPSNIEGRVEICYNGVWGTICDHDWDNRDATVVCKQLGLNTLYPVALYFATYGQGQGPITLDEVDCRGDEGLLLNCSHLPIGSHNCGHYEDASVYCYGATRMISPSASSDFSNSTITIEVPAYVNGIYEIPSNVFSVIDDDINEIEQSFAVIAEIGTDVSDDIVCFQTQVEDKICYGRFGATEIRIVDNDVMVIGFNQRNLVVPEFGTFLFSKSFFNELLIEVTSMKTSERLYNVVFNIQESINKASIATLGQAHNTSFDAHFGETLSPDGHIQQTIGLIPQEDTITLLVIIVNDLEQEDQECFTINISPTDDEFICNDGENATNYFCSITICIDDNDGPIGFSFDQDTYIVAESDDSIEVCVTPNRTLFCSEGDAFILMIVIDIDMDVRTLGEYYLHFDGCFFNDCASIAIGDVVEIRQPFILRLESVSGRDDRLVDMSGAEAMVIFEEDVVRVGYDESSHTLSEANGYVMVCVNATSTGISEEFYIYSTSTGNTINMPDFIHNSSNILSFAVNASHPFDHQCYNISADFSVSNICDYYIDFVDGILITLQLMSYNITDSVSIDGISTTYVLVEWPTKCIQAFTSSTTTAISNGVIAAIVLVIVTILSVVSAISAIIVYQRMRKFKINKDFGNNVDHHFSLDETKKSELLQHLRETLTNKRMIYSKNQIQLSTTIGQGESGLVYKAYINTAIGRELVAVKTGKALFSTSDLERLAKEVSIMLSFEHTNVMSLIGVCIDGEMPLLIMPFMSNGSVLDFIKRRKVEFLLTSKATEQEIQVAGNVLLGMCHQITKGMKYLSEHTFVHRDLAARNCMIDGNGVIKVADFGLTEDIYGTNYFRRRKSVTGSDEKVPIRWMAPESIENDIYTEATDVWSFGVTVWEIYTCGRIPYSGIHPMGLLRELQAGHRLDKPDNAACHDDIYEVMLLCWNIDAAERPKFNSLVNTISGLLESFSGYLELSDSNGSDYVHLSQMFSLKRSPPSESTTASSLPEVEEQKISKQETEV